MSVSVASASANEREFRCKRAQCSCNAKPIKRINAPDFLISTFYYFIFRSKERKKEKEKNGLTQRLSDAARSYSFFSVRWPEIDPEHKYWLKLVSFVRKPLSWAMPFRESAHKLLAQVSVDSENYHRKTKRFHGKRSIFVQHLRQPAHSAYTCRELSAHTHTFIRFAQCVRCATCAYTAHSTHHDHHSERRGLLWLIDRLLMLSKHRAQ